MFSEGSIDNCGDMRNTGLSSHSDTVASEVAAEASKVLAKKIAVLASKEMIVIWTKPAGLIPIPTFLAHMMHLFGNEYKDAKLFEHCWYLPLFY